MKAIVMEEYGPPEVLQLKEVEKPTPESNEVLIKNHAVSVSFGDFVARKINNLSPREFGMPFLFWLITKISFGLNKPKVKILGAEFSGEVEAVGKEVTRYKVGDKIFGYLGQSFGGYAEYLCMPEDGVMTKKPSNMSYEEAAAVPSGGMTAFSILSRANIQPGDKVLINGASGGIGGFAVQLAKHDGAEVTGVCSTPRMEYVRKLGAVDVIDYTKEDFTQNGEKYDIIFDVLGKSSFSRCKNSLTENGRYILASFKTRALMDMLWTSRFGKKKVICSLSPQKVEDLISVGELIEAGKIKSIVDKIYPLEQAAEAHSYVEQGNKKGQIVLTLDK